MPSSTNAVPSVATRPDSPSTPASTAAGPPAQRAWVTAGWAVHWVIRMQLALGLLVYGWSKVFLMQMGRADIGDALVQFGEMSPMGLLWRFMAFSPAVQVLAGLAEVLAAALLLFRRTAWLGGLLTVADMGVVFLLNLTFDVPVKQLALLMCLAGVAVVAPFVPHLWSVLRGRATVRPLPTVLPWPPVHRVTRWLGAVAGVGALAVSGAGFAVVTSGGFTPADTALTGAHRVVEDTAEPAAQLSQDTRWQQVAFGQYQNAGWARVAIRYADGRYQEGTYAVDGDAVTLRLYPVREGSQGLVRDYERTIELTWTEPGEGRVRLVGEGVDLVVAPDPEATYLFDRDFSWTPSTPINR
ncbi:hypothetical protein [Desertihabitans brevis]|nr:hypothetical protein [Desertihabitans brevis]